ncbi:1-deoxy-D-xylulose-5-phosphate reductoisomerase [Candidatus Omnitrophota bacterium]
MKRVAILGSTGSIGRNALDVISRYPARFRVASLSANENIGILSRQIKRFRPDSVCVGSESAALALRLKIKGLRVKVFSGRAGLKELAGRVPADIVLLAISGSEALTPLLSAIDAGRDIALANKEALVMAGSLIMERARRRKVKIIPIDSEQSAIWQCLEGQEKSALKRIYLTASGGPLRSKSKAELKRVSVAKVIKHPKWKMGAKISVDSATLANKGLEVLEAMHLFGVGPDKIRVLIHPEAICHSMVEFVDGGILAQLSATDMRIPIKYALSYPKRLPDRSAGLSLSKIKRLNFGEPDFKKFRCLALAYQVAGQMGTAPAAFNAANEVCVDEFLKGRLDFLSIPKVIAATLERHRNKKDPGLKDIFTADARARQTTYELIKGAS